MQILAPTAGSVPAENNASYIVSIAKSLGADLHVIHISNEGASEDGIKALDIFSTEGEKAGVKTITEIVKGQVADTILRVANDKDVDLIVMGASHGIVVHEWYAADILHKSKTPVVIIPSGLDEITID